MQKRSAISGVLALTILLSCGLSACASAGPGRPAKRDPLHPISASYFRDAGTAHPAPLLTGDEASDLQSLPWRLLSPSDSRDSIVVVYQAGDGVCTKPVGFRVLLERDRVTVAALSRGCRCPNVAGGSDVRIATMPLPQKIQGMVELWHAPVSAGWDNAELRR